MLSDLSVYGIFPIPIGVSKFNRDFYPNELDFINNLDKIRNNGNFISESDDVLFKNDMKEIYDFIISAVDNFYKRVYSPPETTTIYITQSWTNYTNTGEYHHGHKHENSIISGVFYVKANPEIDKVNFDKEPFGFSGEQIRTEPTEFNIFNSVTQEFKVATGDLYLFPSTIFHHVEASKNPETRISLSFNTFLKGTLGSRKNRSLLIL